MTTDRRAHGIERLPSGRLIDRDAERDWLAQMAPERIRVERLSKVDPEIVAFEQTSRERAA